MIPLLINKEKAREIIESPMLKEKRTFFFTEDGLWIGIDNRKGDAWVRKYSTIIGCMNGIKTRTVISR